MLGYITHVGRQKGRMRGAQAESEGLRQMVRSVGLKRHRINYADVFLRQLINQEEGGKERGGQEQSAVSSLPPFHFHPALFLRPDRSRRPSSRPRPPPTSPLSSSRPDRSPRTLCAGADTQLEPPTPYPACLSHLAPTHDQNTLPNRTLCNMAASA